MALGLSVSHGQTALEPLDCRAPGLVKPYEAIREADVMWERRAWRTVDLNDPVNLPFRASQGGLPGCMSLFGLVRHGLLDEGGIVAYDPGPTGQDDAFRVPFGREALRTLFAALDTLSTSAVTRFMIKEDWIFDKRRSVMEARIIGIAPMLELRSDDGELRGHRPLFWLYYPECRLLFARWAASADKDGRRLSFEDLFAQRRFKGTIVKVSNMQDRTLSGHRAGLDALLESEGLREQLFQMGFDLWHY